MDRFFWDSLIEQIRDKHPEVDIYSREFFFEPKYSMIRNQQYLQVNPSSKRTLLSFLLHEGMIEEKRSAIFPNEFDLGNLHEVPKAICKPAELLNYLDLPPEDGSAPLKHIHAGVKLLTGRSISDYYKVNLSNALKVTKTLYFLTRNRNENRLFSKLANPENGKSGLEFRESYQHKKSSALGYLVSDVREYLGAELSTQKITQIQAAFESISAAYDKVMGRLQTIPTNKSINGDESARSFFDELYVSIKKYQHPLAPDNLVQLDEALYLHITSLPFRHFAQQYPNLHSIGVRPLPLIPLSDHIKIEEYRLTRIPINKISDVLQSHAAFFISIASTLTNSLIDIKNLKKYAPLVTAVVDRVEVFEPKQSIHREDRDTSLLRIVTAISAIHDEHIQKTSHMPYWHGQQAVGDSLLTSLKTELNDESVYEEHTQIWRIRLNWLSATLCGESALYKQRSDVEMLVLHRFSEIARVQNIDALEKATQLFLQHIETEFNHKFIKVRFAY
jgi:hypothetical protein